MMLPNDRFWTISNLFSLSRIFIVFPAVWFLFQRTENTDLIATGLLVIAAVTDGLDGYIARKFNQVSDWGKILDPLSDKICIITVILGLLWLDLLPLWFVLLVAGRDVLIFAGGIYFKKRVGYIPMSIPSGKFAVFFTGFTLLFAILKVEPWYHYFLYLSVILLFYSFGEYAVRMVRELKKVP